MSYAEVEMKIVQWSEKRKIIPNSTALAQARKAKEEINELIEALECGDHVAAIDGAGDTGVCLINVCALMDVNFVDCLYHAFEQIKDRTGTMGADGIFYKNVV